MSSADDGAAGSPRASAMRGQRSSRPRQDRHDAGPHGGVLDELPQSGVLEDVGSDTDDIQQELDEAGSPPKWTKSSPRLRPRSARAHRRRPS
jgi:hypothetical protein